MKFGHICYMWRTSISDLNPVISPYQHTGMHTRTRNALAPLQAIDGSQSLFQHYTVHLGFLDFFPIVS
jgi:hypothetical protein